jgi:hypothetical protein
LWVPLCKDYLPERGQEVSIDVRQGMSTVIDSHLRQNIRMYRHLVVTIGVCPCLVFPENNFFSTFIVHSLFPFSFPFSTPRPHSLYFKICNIILSSTTRLSKLSIFFTFFTSKKNRSYLPCVIRAQSYYIVTFHSYIKGAREIPIARQRRFKYATVREPSLSNVRMQQ